MARDGREVGVSGLSRDEIAREMRRAVLDLLDEICKADGFDVRARDAGWRALDKAMRALLSTDARGVDWARLDGMSAEQVRTVTREALRPVVMRELAPLRPS